MTGLTAELLRTAKRLKLIIQYGVGVEGIDIVQVCFMCAAYRLRKCCSLQSTCCLYTCLKHPVASLGTIINNPTGVLTGDQTRNMGEQHSQLWHWQCSVMCRACHLSHACNATAAKCHEAVHSSPEDRCSCWGDTVWEDSAYCWIWQHCQGAHTQVSSNTPASLTRISIAFATTYVTAFPNETGDAVWTGAWPHFNFSTCNSALILAFLP